MNDNTAQGAPTPEASGGQGVLNDPHHTRADLAMIAQAARNGWGVTDEMKRIGPEIAAQIASDNSADPRARTGALKALATFDQINQTDFWNADKNKRLDSGLLTERTGLEPVIVRRPINDAGTPTT